MLLKYFCVFLIVLQSGTIIEISCNETTTESSTDVATNMPSTNKWNTETQYSTEPTIDYRSTKFKSTVGHSTAKPTTVQKTDNLSNDSGTKVNATKTTTTKTTTTKTTTNDNSRKGEAQSMSHETKDKDHKNQGIQIKGNILASIVTSTAVLYISIMN